MANRTARTPPSRRGPLRLFMAGLALFAVLLAANAWVVDDAYITFRTVDNAVHGLGLRWNAAERVQVYTHPLWLLVLIPTYAITREPFYTSIFLSLGASLAAVWIAGRAITDRFRASPGRGPLLLLALISTKAFADYTTSGLENGLSYLLAALFYTQLRGIEEPSRAGSRMVRAALIAALAFLNRPDTVLLYLPGTALLAGRSREIGGRAVARRLVPALFPAAAWLLFALVYYGFPLPNTAYAKSLCTGFPASWEIRRGLAYLGNSLRIDAAGHLMTAGACLLAVRRRDATRLALLAGILLYSGYIVRTAGASTHLAGRFFALPLFLGVLAFVDLLSEDRRAKAIVAVALAVYILVSPVAAVKFGTPLYRPGRQDPSAIDAKWYALNEGAALLNGLQGRGPLPDHDWLHYGRAFRRAPETVHRGGAHHQAPIGFMGYAAGPRKFIIDEYGLSDPLLARLPAERPDSYERWKSGHFLRAIPAGYPQSVIEDGNRIVDPQTRAYYDAVRTVTRGPLFRWRRLRAILRLNVGGCGPSP